jgi:hypothetical protein
MAQRIALKVTLICVLILAGMATLAAFPAHDLHLATICPGPSYADGTPAIHPRNDCTPSFTEQDVRSYLAANLQFALVDHQSGLPNGVTFVGRPQIVSIRFLSARDLGRESHPPAWIAPPPDTLVCSVTLHGTFFPIHGPLSLYQINFHYAYIVFDAHSGGLLGNGFGNPLGP